VSEQLVHDEQGWWRKTSFTYPEGIRWLAETCPNVPGASALGFIAQVRLEITITPWNRA
jgi:hypothetical protein